MSRLFPVGLLFLLLAAGCTNFSTRGRAERSVMAYMNELHADHSPDGFGEFFEQQGDTKDIEAIIGTDRTVKYSLVHSYHVGDSAYVDSYFHLDEDLTVLGTMTMDEMMTMTMKELEPRLEELMKEKQAK